MKVTDRIKRLFIKSFIILEFLLCVYIVFRSKLSVLVFHNSFKFTSRGLDCVLLSGAEASLLARRILTYYIYLYLTEFAKT